MTADANFEFDPLSPVVVDGFELELDAGLGSPVTYVPLEVVDSGTAAPTDGIGDLLGLTEGQYFAVEAVGGSFHPFPPPDQARTDYRFSINLDGYVGRVWDGTYNLITPATCLFSEAVNSLYGRVYLLAPPPTSGIYITVGDRNFADNSGAGISYVVRNARADGRRVTLGGATIKNICPVDS